MEPESLSELASLYALGSSMEQEDLAELGPIQTSPLDDDALALETEAAELENAVAALAYAVPPQPMAASLKDRLFNRIAADSEVQAEDSASESIAALLRQSSQAAWQPYSTTPAIQIATLRIDKANRRVDYFVRSLGPANFPQHRHAGDEEIVVLQGQVEIDGQAYGVGDRILSSPGTVHQPITHTGCTLLLRTSLDDEVLA